MRLVPSRLLLAGLALLLVASGCSSSPSLSSSSGSSSGAASSSTRVRYDPAGRLAEVSSSAGSAIYRYDDAGNRVAVSRSDASSSGSSAPSVSPSPPSPRAGPQVYGVSPRLVAQGARVVVTGSGFDPSPLGDVVEVGGGLGRVVSASADELVVELPPGAAPGRVTVSTAFGRSRSAEDLVVAPAEVDPREVTSTVSADQGKAVAIPPGVALVTFVGTAGTSFSLQASPSDSEDGSRTDAPGCDGVEVGLAGPTGTIMEADAGAASWCDRPARLPMTGTYVATVSSPLPVEVTVVEVVVPTPARLASAGDSPMSPGVSAANLPSDPAPRDGPEEFPVDLSTGLLDLQVTDLGLGGSGAADLTRSFSTGDPALPALAPEEPLARHWSLGASLAIEPSMSYSYLDLILPDGQRLPYQRVTEGAPEAVGAVFEPSGGAGAGPFAGSQVSWTGVGWELRTRTDTVVGFGRSGSPLRMAWLRDPSGRTARFLRGPAADDGSPDGDLVEVVSEDGRWARFEHDSEHRIVAATDHIGDRISYHYGRPAGVYSDVLLSVTSRPASGASSTVGYRYARQSGRLAAVTDGRRDRVRFEYDEAGRVVRQVQLGPRREAGEWRYSYEVGQRRVRFPGRDETVRVPVIRRATVGGTEGRRTVGFGGGRWVSDTSTAGTVRATRDRRTGGLRSVRDVDGTVIRVGHEGDPHADVEEARWVGYVELERPGSPRRAVFIDALGRLAATRDAEGAVTRLRHDASDRVAAVTDPDGAVTRFGYTRDGDLASVTDPAGTTRHSWNGSGQQISETDPLGRRQEWDYDGAGRLVRSRDARGVVATFGYDRAGRLEVARYGVRAHGPPASRVDYRYDSGRLVGVRDSAADGPVALRYDAQGRVLRETSRYGSLTSVYDAEGRRTGLRLPGGMQLRTKLRGDGLPASLSLVGGGHDAQVTADYEDGRLSGLKLPSSVSGRLDYRAGALVGIDYRRGQESLARQRLERDAAGRIDGFGGDLGRPALPEPALERAFDGAHQVTTSGGGERWVWDRAGHLLRDDTRRYIWDERGRLVAVDGPTGRVSYGYDAWGRRTSVTSAGKTVRFVHDGDDVVQSVAADGTRTSYLRGPEGTPLAMSSDSGVTALLPDALGNVAAAVAPDGDVSRFSYDPFGAPRAPPPDGVPGFRGLLADPAGLVQMGARTYDPASGRFLSRDTWGIAGGDTDPYRYARAAPTVFTDPSGHASECVGLALGWATSVLGPEGGWDDYDALEDKLSSGEITQDEWSVEADRLSHDIWAGFDVVADVCGTSVVGSSAAALPLLGSSKLTGRVLGSLADDAVTGAATTRRIGSGFGELGATPVARGMLERFLGSRGLPSEGLVSSRSVRFTQDSVGATFRDGRAVSGLAAEMGRTGSVPADLPAIRIFRVQGNLYSLDNRRLFAGQYADVDLPYRWATAAEISMRRRTEIFEGTSISLRRPGGEKNWEWWQP